MTLTDEQRVLYQGYLAEAEKAYHTLRLGGMARVFVDQNGERVEFTAASTDKLRAYILELRGLLGLPTGIVGPMNMWAV